MQHKIKLLNQVTISKIATGEVVDRPLSVVKELVENSIDAQARVIDIKIARGGRSLISISDNGMGIAKEDLTLAVTRHATSKLLEEDISNILHMGFRGEALASIATAARLHLTSRTAESEQGWQIRLDEGPTASLEARIEPAPHSVGTTTEVLDLFCFMPNRVRFLKPETTEVMACTELINSLAIAHPQIRFSLNHNGKNILEFVNSDGIEERVEEVLGKDFIENAVYFDTGENYKEINRIRLFGYLSVPTSNRSTNNKIFTFVNKRLVKDNFLNKLVRVSYFNTLPEGITPSVVLFIEMPVKCVDVNIHPNKSEVRFSDERLIREIVINSIRDSIRKVKTSPKIPEKLVEKFELFQPTLLPVTKAMPSNLPEVAPPRVMIQEKKQASPTDMKAEMKVERAREQDREISHGYLGIPKFQIGTKYVVAENEKGLILVDQHAAHERIVLEQINKKYFGVQKLLVPLAVDFGPAGNELLLSSDLKKIGIELTSEDFSSLLVHSVPSLLDSLDVISLLEDVVKDLDSYKEIMASHQDKVLAKIACYSSLRAGRKLTLEEMDKLLRLIETTDFSSQCIHGRPTYIELSVQHLDRLFERS